MFNIWDKIPISNENKKFIHTIFVGAMGGLTFGIYSDYINKRRLEDDYKKLRETHEKHIQEYRTQMDAEYKKAHLEIDELRQMNKQMNTLIPPYRHSSFTRSSPNPPQPPNNEP